MPPSPLQQLSALGQSVWVDFLSRQALEDGTIERLIREYTVVGMTSNPTIFQWAMAEARPTTNSCTASSSMRPMARRSSWHWPRRIFGRPVTCCGRRGNARSTSTDRSPWRSTRALAYDKDGTIAEASRLHELVDRRNLYVKIPATEPGVAAIEETIAAGIPVNVTLIFSLERHRAVIEAYLRGVERLTDAGGSPFDVPSVASFFVSRVDTETDRRLDDLGGHDQLRGRLAIANAKLAYQQYRDAFSGERWERLVRNGARPQRCLWASTSVKDPRCRDTMYVEELIGPQTVNTMPPDTLAAVQDHGHISPTLDRDLQDAHRVFKDLADAGVELPRRDRDARTRRRQEIRRLFQRAI